jgi:hypothetical protein
MFIIFPRRSRPNVNDIDYRRNQRAFRWVIGALVGAGLLVGVGKIIIAAQIPKAAKQDAATLGEIALKDVPHSTFGYLRSALSPLSPAPAIEDCVGGGQATAVRYYNCKLATWGRGQLFMAIFVTRQGFYAPKNVSDDRQVAGLRINSEFRGTLCGKSMREVMDSGTACGAQAEIEKNGNRASFIYVGLRRDSVNRPIY